MHLFHEALLTNGNSNSFTAKSSGTFILFLTGTFASETFTMEMAPGEAATTTWVTYLPDGVQQDFAITNYVQSYLAAGQKFRLNGDGGGGGTTDVDCYVGGDVVIV